MRRTVTAHIRAEDASFVTGQCFVIDGGEIAGGMASHPRQTDKENRRQAPMAVMDARRRAGTLSGGNLAGDVFELLASSKKSEEIVTANSKTNVLYQQVREKIVCGEIKPGAILTEAGLADEYGVSKAPVREALVLLGHEGFVEPMPRIGHVVASFHCAGCARDLSSSIHIGG